MNEIELLESCGGVQRFTGGETVWDFGFRKSEPSDLEGVDVQPFKETENVPEIKGDKVFLWEYAKLANGGKIPHLNWQVTGSCVNGGAQNAFIVRQCVEICLKPESEAYKVPFTLLAYGQSRWDAFRDASEGEGSRGDAMAKALASLGVVPIDDPEVTKPRFTGPAMVWTRRDELRWSSVRNHPQGVKDRAKRHRLKYVVVTSANQAEAELRRGRPLTWAGDWGGLNSCPVVDGVLLNRRQGVWQHQQSVLGMWLHPSLGRIFYVQNQWFYEPRQGAAAISVHGLAQNGEPEGGYWIREGDMDYQCRTGEVRSLHSINGFTGDVDFMGV